MSLSVQLGAGSLVQLGISLSDIAVLMRNGVNWLKTRQNDHNLFESISERYGEVLRRRGLVDVAWMDDTWGRKNNFIYQGKTVQHTFPSSTHTEGLEGFSWLMVSIITSLDLCLTTTLIQSVLIDTFIAVLDRDDKAELSESLGISLSTNIESWRYTGCVRAMVVPLTKVIRQCRKEATGENGIPQLNPCERQELVDLLIWLFSGDTKQFQAISATCYSLVAGWKKAGICINLGTPQSSTEFSPTVCYTQGVGEDYASTEVLELGGDLFPSQRTIPPQRCLFRFGHPEEMIECLRRPIPVRNNVAIWWHRGAEAAESFRIQFSIDARRIIYHITHNAPCARRWPSSTLNVSKTWFTAADDKICQAIEDFTYGKSAPFEQWIKRCLAEGRTANQLDNPRINFSVEELDTLLCFQGLVYGFWYQLLGQLFILDHLQEDVLISAVWGWRDAAILETIFDLTRENEAEGIERSLLMGTLRRMFLGEIGRSFRDEQYHRRLVAIIGPISLVCFSLLQLPQLPQDCAKFALVSLPIVELFGDQHGELLSSNMDDGIETYQAEPQPLGSSLSRICPRRPWSVHAKLNFVNGRVENVSMIARCGGVPVHRFPPHSADRLFLAMDLHSPLDCSYSSQMSVDRDEGAGDYNKQSYYGNEITEENFLQGSIPEPCVMIDDRRPWLTLVHSSESAAMRYTAIGVLSALVLGHKAPLAIRNSFFHNTNGEPSFEKDTRAGESHILCRACDLRTVMEKVPPYATMIL